LNLYNTVDLLLLEEDQEDLLPQLIGQAKKANLFDNSFLGVVFGEVSLN